MGVGGNGPGGRADSGRGGMGTKGAGTTGVLGWPQSRAPPPLQVCPSVAWRSPALYHHLTTQPLPQNTESSRYTPSEERLVREVPCLSYPTPQDRSCPSSYRKAVSGTVGSQALGIPVLSPVPIPIGVRGPLSSHSSPQSEREDDGACDGIPCLLLPQQQALCQDSGDPRWSG